MLFLIDNFIKKKVLASSVLVAFVRFVFPSRRDAVDIEQGHYSFNLFMVDFISSISQLKQYSSIAIPSFVPVIYFFYLFKDFFVFIIFINLVNRVEECRFFNFRDLKKDVQFVGLP